MASSKDTFESHSFRAHSFASGLFRGAGADIAFTLVDRWANATRLNVDAFGRLTAYTDSTRSEVKCDNGRTE